MVKVLAITGGIGSGKSYIVKIFAGMGIPVYNADERTKTLYDTSSELLEGLKGLLGEELVKDGKLDKVYMAARVFSDRSLLEKVEAVVFPAVAEDFESWKKQYEGAGCPFVVLESAIILEKPFFRSVYDRVLTVSSPVEIRIPRVMARSAMTREEVVQRISNQWDDLRREAASDYVIVSDEKHALLPQVLDICYKMNN